MRFFLFGVFICWSANAATMCVPDLSECESCSDYTYEEMKWSANCCGVQVQGFYIEDAFESTATDYTVEMKDVVMDDYDLVVSYRQIFFMTHPFVARYGVVEACQLGEHYLAPISGRFAPKYAIGGGGKGYKCDKSYK